MSLKYALLGFLGYQPMTGYDLKHRFDHSIYYFWNAELSQIYPTLTKMKEDGLLTMDVEFQDDKPNRKVYNITKSGRDELRRWLLELEGAPKIRISFLIKMFFAGMLKKEDVLTQLEHQLVLHQAQLVDYQEAVRNHIHENIEATGMKRDGEYWELTLEMGIKFEEGWIEWCQESIEKIKGMNDE